MKDIKDLTGFDKFHKGIHQRRVCQFGQMKDFILSDRQEVLKMVEKEIEGFYPILYLTTAQKKAIKQIINNLK